MARASTTAKGGSKVKSVNELEIKPNAIYEFELDLPKGQTHDGIYIVPKHGMSYDESDGTFKRVRLSESETSPYLEEQSEESTASRELLKFKRGKLSVSGYRENVVRYLLAFDGNAEKTVRHHSNRGLSFKYKLKDKEAIFKKSANDMRLEVKAKSLLLEAEVEELTQFLVAYYDYKTKTDSEDEIVAVALGKAESNPQFVIENFKTEQQVLKFKVIEGFKKELLTNNKGVVSWTDNGLEVGKFGNADVKLSDDMVAWIIKGSKESKDFIGRLTDSLAKI